MEALRLGPLAVRGGVTEEIWAMLLSLAKRVHPADFIFPTSHCGAPRNEAADKEATIARSLPQDCVNAWHVEFLAAVKGLYWKEFQEERNSHTPHARRLSVWRNSIPGVDPDIVPEWRIFAQARRDSCPLFDRPARSAGHKEPSVSVVPSLSLPRRPTRLCLRRNLFQTKTPQLLVDQRAADRSPLAQSAAECARLSAA
ncbi:hypothetical protein TcBrA4_0111750 [Trypanosoma cruzi]|nr:hypothetical protein TcBrA4_0111750 [Trypanosoma cruzi]